MNTVSSSLPAHVIAPTSAANADHVGDDPTVSTVVTVESTGGWDSYEVWRRLIKDARDRRQHQE